MHPKAKFVFLLSLLVLILPNAARADVIYTYTGNPYTGCGGTGVDAYVCNGTTPALSITFDVATPLSDNLNLKNIAKQFVSLTITDGTGLDITLANVSSDTFDLSTDSSGNITDWSIDVSTSSSASAPTSYLVISENQGNGKNRDYSSTSLTQYNGRIGTVISEGSGENDGTGLISSFPPADAGTWTRVNPTPEPSALILLATGLLGLIAFTRIRRAPHSYAQRRDGIRSTT